MTLYLFGFWGYGARKLSEDTIIKASQTDQNIAGICKFSNNKIVWCRLYNIWVDYYDSRSFFLNATTVMITNYLSNNDPDAFGPNE